MSSLGPVFLSTTFCFFPSDVSAEVLDNGYVSSYSDTFIIIILPVGGLFFFSICILCLSGKKCGCKKKKKRNVCSIEEEIHPLQSTYEQALQPVTPEYLEILPDDVPTYEEEQNSPPIYEDPPDCNDDIYQKVLNSVQPNPTNSAASSEVAQNATEIAPNLAKLRCIKTSELIPRQEIGRGAFGFVLKGYWIPEGTNTRIHVAIKTLYKSEAAAANILEEAFIMASLKHPCIHQLLALCLTSDIQLVSLLMPLGNLLHYVKKNKHQIKSKEMLCWSIQIAWGMAYLEKNRLVHRDLAARNVLVETPTKVKVTDFGLARLLNLDENEYTSRGGKMPLKWLAIESFYYKIFTHKSDVWAYGVTLWEIFTFGCQPYESIDNRQLLPYLESGKRLSQPNICTINVFKVLLSCWLEAPNQRPSFDDLAKQFIIMSEDPGRYLVIKGDKYMRIPSYIEPNENVFIECAAVNTNEVIEEVHTVERKSEIKLQHKRSCINQSENPLESPLFACKCFRKDRFSSVPQKTIQKKETMKSRCFSENDKKASVIRCTCYNSLPFRSRCPSDVYVKVETKELEYSQIKDPAGSFQDSISDNFVDAQSYVKPPSRMNSFNRKKVQSLDRNRIPDLPKTHQFKKYSSENLCLQNNVCYLHFKNESPAVKRKKTCVTRRPKSDGLTEFRDLGKDTLRRKSESHLKSHIVESSV